MAKGDTKFKGYRARFKKGGKILRETISEHLCPRCGDGTKGMYTQVWLESDVKDRSLYQIYGTCPKGHDVERFGFGEIPAEVPSLQGVK